MGCSDFCIGCPKMELSTSDYNNACEGRHSPCITDKEIKISKKNRENIRKKIEKKLSKIPKDERKELSIFMKRMYSDHVRQLIDIKIIKKNENFYEVYPDVKKYDDSSDSDKNYKLVTGDDIGLDNYIWDDNVWNGFDYNPFYQKCKICGKEIKQIGKEDITCQICKEKEEKNKFINKWKKASPAKKLEFYGKTKLLILAKNKKINGYSKMNKDELIDNLSLIVTKNDFPIK